MAYLKYEFHKQLPNKIEGIRPIAGFNSLADLSPKTSSNFNDQFLFWEHKFSNLCSEAIQSPDLSRRRPSQNEEVIDKPSVSSSEKEDHIKKSDISPCLVPVKEKSKKLSRKDEEKKPLQQYELTDAKIRDMKRKKWLSDEEMNAGMLLMKQQFPEIGGLNDTILGINAFFPKAREESWLQIIHDGINHWVLAAFGFPCLPPNKAVLFDSKKSQNKPNYTVLAAISSLLQTDDPEFIITMTDCQQQKNGYDCGGLVLAFSTALLFGYDPCSFSFDAPKLIEHYKQCLTSKVLTPFPYFSLRRPSVRRETYFNVQVHCTCRRPAKFKNNEEAFHKDEEMAECENKKCKRWFHRVCENIPEKVFSKNSKWQCKLCKSGN